MALDKLALKIIGPRLRGARVLCLGYPDLLPLPADVGKILDVQPRSFVDLGRHYKLAHQLAETLDTFALAGAVHVAVVDVARVRGMERLLDLNQPQEWPEQYDLVVDPGTLEHCFQIGTAMFNAWRAVKPGGAIFHMSPMTMVNHGFFNLCPTLFQDFAAANGGHVLQLHAKDRDGNRVDIDPIARFSAPNNTSLYVLTEKVQPVPEQVPVQWRYQTHLVALAAAASSACSEVLQAAMLLA